MKKKEHSLRSQFQKERLKKAYNNYEKFLADRRKVVNFSYFIQTLIFYQLFTEKQNAQQEKMSMFEKKREQILLKNSQLALEKQKQLKNVQVTNNF